MERWNELIAGHVLGNLTDEEQAELSAVLRKKPQLRLEISRLRKTATMSHSQQGKRASEKSEAGAEGWADTVQRLPQSPSVQPAFPAHEQLVAAVVNSANAELGRRVMAEANRGPFECTFRRLPAVVDTVFQRTSLLGWLMVIALVGIGLDNYRMRRLLAIAEERILQLELSVEYSSGRTE